MRPILRRPYVSVASTSHPYHPGVGSDSLNVALGSIRGGLFSWLATGGVPVVYGGTGSCCQVHLSDVLREGAVAGRVVHRFLRTWREMPTTYGVGHLPPLPHGTNSKFVGGKEGGACLKGCRAMSLPNCPPLVRGVGGVGVIGMARVVVGVAGRGSRFAIGGGGLGYWDRNQSRRSSNLLVSRSSSVRLGRRTMRRRMPSDLHRWNTTTTWWGTRVEDHEQLRQDHRRRGDDVASSGAGVITGPR